MPETDVKIVVQIKSFIEENGGNYHSWYVGLADDPVAQLISHGVNLDSDPYIHRTATRIEDARGVGQYFIAHVGTDGDTRGNSSEKALSVYAYKKTKSTNP